MRSVKCSRKLATATASLFWQKCLEFRGEKPFIILNSYVYALFSYSFSFDASLWWPLLLSTVPQHITMFPDSIIAG